MKWEVFNKEISYIKDARYRENIKILLNLLPDYFYLIPASSTGKYHPAFASSKGGLVRHTKVAVRIAHELLENDSLGNVFESFEKDLMIMALMIHDGLKKGVVEGEYTVFEHPLLIANFVKENQDKLTLNEKEVNFIAHVVLSHMGKWNTSRYSSVVLQVPIDKYQKFVHMCDYLASKKFINVSFLNNDIID